jgi:hypothetical protein
MRGVIKMTFALSGWMLYTMWAVLGLVGLNVLAGMYRAVMSNSFSLSKVPNFLNGILTTVLPMLILSGVTSIDNTDWLAETGYYAAGIGSVWKYLKDIKGKF